MSSARTVRNVLSIDGCGFRGRTQLLVLKELMVRHSGKPDDPSRPSDVFDLICGTATGGLIAILVGRLGMTCDEAIQAYDSLEKEIFHATPTIQAILARSEGFDPKLLQKSLSDLIERHTPSRDPEALMLADNQRGCRTLVTVVHKSAAVDTDAERIRSYAIPTRKDGPTEPEIIPDHKWKIWQAALGATSCSFLFSPLTLDEFDFMAANTSGFSNPSMIAYLEALDLFGQNHELTLISLGMGLRNRHDYGSLSKDGIDQMFKQLGAPNNKPFVFVDYTQKEVIENITNEFFRGFPDRLNDAVDFLQRVDSKWKELRGYSCGSDQPDAQVDMRNMNPRQIMRECLRWEEANRDRRISFFTMNTAGTPKSVKMFTGDIQPVDDDDSTLFVRILLDDEWRFFPQSRAPESNWEGDKGAAMDPIAAILNARANKDIRAFRSDGLYTTSNVSPDQVNTYEFGFSLPCDGTWVRTGTA